MRRKLKFNQSLRVRWLLPLLVCLLLPAGMQAEDYGLTVAGIQVTSDNASGVTGDNITGTITFDATKNILTLNNVTFTVNGDDAIVSGLEQLTIFLVGENYITCYGNSNVTINKTAAVDVATVIFTTEKESNGSLYIVNTEERLFGNGVTPTYSYVSIKNNGDNHTIDSSCGISVGDVAVTLFNAEDVFGDGKVSYNSTNHLLTLNNAAIKPENETSGIVYSDDVDLTIALIGDNSVQGAAGCTAISHPYGVKTPYLHFAKGDANHCSLEMVASVGVEIIDGFLTNNEEGGFFWIGDEGGETYSTIVSSSVFGGTGSEDEPFLMKTAEDLKKFANYYNVGYFNRNSHVQLYNDIDCIDLEGFTTIADNTDGTFIGVFDGNSKTISNLSMTGLGLFGYVEGDGNNIGVIKDLTLDNFKMSGENNYAIGGIVTELSNGGMVSNCRLVNSSISCSENQYNPEVGGIVSRLNNAIVTGCVLDNTSVNAVSNYPLESGPRAYAGGIVASCIAGSISNCQVINASRILNLNADGCPLSTGAIVANSNEGTFSSNTYTFDVTVEMGLASNPDTKETKSGYTHRGTNEEVDPDGANLYTKTVLLPKKNDEATVTAREGSYYAQVDNGILAAPNQTVTLDVTPTEEYAISSFTVTNSTTSETIATTSSEEGEYSFNMPDADVEVVLTTVSAYLIKLVGTKITELNALDVLGDGTVSFDINNNMLMLNNTNIGNGGTDPMEAPGIDYSGTADLTIRLIGKNTISGMGGCEAIRYNGDGNTTPRLIFVKGDTQTCSLQLNATQSTVISGGFGEVRGVNGINAAQGNKLKLDTENTVLYSNDNGLYVNADTHLEPVTSANITSFQQRADIVWKAGEGNYSYEIDGSEVTADAGGYYIYTNGETPWLNNPDNLAVTFSSSDESVATIDSKGTITIAGVGRTTISATVAETDELLETTSSFTLKVYPENAEFEKMFDLLFPGETVTITCKTADAEIWYYTGNQSREDAVKYTGPITLTTIGETNIMAFTKSTKNDEVFESSTAVSGRFVVFEQPTISVASGTFNDDVEVTIGKLPTRYGTQVCYYFNDELSDDIYTSTDMLDETKYHVYVEDEVIKIIESKILKVFIMEQDSGKYYKKKAAEEEYTVIPKTELNISYAQNSREWASYYADEKSLETPTGLQAYVVTEVQESGVTTSPISYIPQGEGILLKRTENIQEPIMAKAFMDVEPETASNKLKGTATSKSVKTENGDVYVLYNDGFTRAPSGSIPAHRAYLVLNDESAGARLLIWEDEETTGVSSVETESRQNNDTYYNLNGQRVNKPTKGLYISKGKKHIVK